MSNITLDQIKSLREKTGVSTMSCKKALEEANGDEATAIEILRKKGEAKSAERSDRNTNFGVVAIEESEGKAAIVSLGCETDFVAKNEDFVKEAKIIAKEVLEKGMDLDLSAKISDLNIKMGEKIEVKEIQIIAGANIGSYIHSNNRIGSLVTLSAGSNETAKDIAMHIAAMNPKVISPTEVSEEAVNKEKEIWTEQLKNEGKPAEIIEKIMAGKEKKFREENALLSQAFVKNPDQTVGSLLKEAKLEAFYRLEA